MTHSHSHSSGITMQTVVSPASCHSSVPTCPLDHDVLRVLDIATRDAIPACRRYEGLWVEVLSNLKFYRLIGGLSNDCWVVCGGGHGGEISPDDLPIASKTEKGIVQIGENISVDADGLIAVAKASEDAAGVVELASVAEAKAGTDATKAVTPAGLADALVQDKVDHPLPIASKTEKGVVQIGENISVDADGLIAVARASEDAAGVVELASVAEAKAGTDTTKAVTPAGLADALKSKVSEVINTIVQGFTTMETLRTSGTWTAPKTGVIKVRVIGGGGSGGGRGSSGGGAGYITEAYLDVTAGQAIPVIIGAGGASVPWIITGTNNYGKGGGTSRFGTISASGGVGGSHAGGRGGGVGVVGGASAGICGCSSMGGNNGTNIGDGGDSGYPAYDDLPDQNSKPGSPGGIIIEY